MSSQPLLIFFSLSSCLCCLSALAVLLLPMKRAYLGSLCDLRRYRSPWRPTCIGSGGSWYYANWELNLEVRTLRAFLGSDLGAASQRLGGDTVDSPSNIC